VSDCIFCGKPAGIFHNKHHECAEKYESGRRQITHLIFDSPSSMDSIGSTASKVIQIAARSFISEPERKDLFLAAWSLAVAFRIPYAKIVSFEPFDNGLGIMRDGVSAKPQIFVTHDGWFSYNLVSNLAHV
jgi:hypothetical protein